MKTVLTLTLLVGVASAAISVPVSAGSNSGLRGMFAPLNTIANFEGRFEKPDSATTSRQERRSQVAAPTQRPSYEASNYAPSSYTHGPQDQTETVRYYSAEEYYGQNGYEGQSDYPTSETTSWQQRRLQASAAYAQPGYNTSSQNYLPSQSYGSAQSYETPNRTAENNYPFQETKKHSRSKYGNVYDYERGHCGTDCTSIPATQPVTYRQITEYRCWDGSLVSNANGCAPQTITQTIPQYKCWDGEVVTDADGCRRQTITQEVTRTRDTAYGNTYQSPAPTSVECPSGTSKQSDGTCLQFSSDFSSQSSSVPTTSYGSDSSYSGSNYSSLPENCPSGTTAQSDGTCMEVAPSYNSNPFAGASVELFGGNTSTSVTPSYGYETTNSFGLRSYRPIRK